MALSAVLLLWYPVQEDLAYSQFNLFMLLILSAARWSALRHRFAWAGILVGIAILVKLFAWPLLLLFVQRQKWRALASAVVVMALGYSMTIWVVGFSQVLEYFLHVLPAVSRSYQVAFFNMSLWTAGQQVFQGIGVAPGLRQISTSPLWYSESATVISFVVLSGLLLLLAYRTIARQSLDAAFATMVCVSVLVSPLAWPHYFVLLLIPLTYVTLWCVSHGLPSRETTRMFLLMVVLFPPLSLWGALAAGLAGARYSNGVLSIPFAPSLLRLVPTLSAVALCYFVSTLRSDQSGDLDGAMTPSRRTEANSSQPTPVLAADVDKHPIGR